MGLIVIKSRTVHMYIVLENIGLARADLGRLVMKMEPICRCSILVALTQCTYVTGMQTRVLLRSPLHSRRP